MGLSVNQVESITVNAKEQYIDESHENKSLPFRFLFFFFFDVKEYLIRNCRHLNRVVLILLDIFLNFTLRSLYPSLGVDGAVPLSDFLLRITLDYLGGIAHIEKHQIIIFERI